ncbi:MAG: hypothetical protein K9H61_13290 [Bacteroidia bacterium]|nr:hypothetical protein [Bacteroidia bacterium]MCF8428398.1 hypothetical protein [Bacteroidia bacterium]MCF8447957.1 hypothetical protein [Bacteroidia bacterium]
MKKALLILTLGFGLLASCKKEDSTTTSNNSSTLTTAQKIQNKWNFVSVIDYNYVGASTTLDYIDTLALGSAGDYLDFKTNNKVHISIDGEQDSLDYSIVGDTKLIFDGDTYDITKITANEFVFTYSERIDPPYYDNVIVLKR